MKTTKDKNINLTKNNEEKKQEIIESEGKDANLTKTNAKKEKEILETEILKNLPPDIKKVVEMGFSMQRVSGVTPNPLLSKITEKHIDKILDISQEEEKDSYKDAQSSKKYNLAYFILILVFIGLLIYFLIDKDKILLSALIEKAIFVICGFAGGYGFKSYLDNKRKT